MCVYGTVFEAVCQQMEDLMVYLEGHSRRIYVAKGDRGGEDVAKGVQGDGKDP